jgi:DNA polymerase III subunit delta'
MTYQSTAGHGRVKALLSSAVERGSIPPTLLFAGPQGVGKRLVAQATAAALNCLSPVRGSGGIPFDACGTCRSCDRIARGMHVDVLTLEPDDMAVIKIDVVRDVLERTAFRPFEGRRRVVIIRDAHTLIETSQNALLKSLEEPPPGSVFILTTSVPGALLPTVRSRCMHLRFGRLTETELVEILTARHEMSERDARVAAALADGSVAQALAFQETDPLVLRETAAELLRRAGKPSPASVKLQAAASLISTPSRQERTRDQLSLVLRFASSMLRDLELLNSGGDTRALANAGFSDELSAIAGSYAGDRARDAFVVLARAVEALSPGRNAGTKVVADWVATQI